MDGRGTAHESSLQPPAQRMVQCYASTNDSDDQDKEEFYMRLLNIIIVMGDFNAEIGGDNRGCKEIMG